MQYFGDVSGHLKGVLQGDCEVCVAAVVAGSRMDCYRCPKRTVRRITDIDEAKWTQLDEVQKRRFFTCLGEEDDLQFGYVVIDRQALHSMEHYHYLYQDVTLPPDWDLALEGYAYGEILFEMGAPDDPRGQFTFDRISSQAQTQSVAEHVTEFVPETEVTYDGSRQCSGIQTADCLAGGIVEEIRDDDADWLDAHLNTADVAECNDSSLIQLENDLDIYRRR